MLLEEILMQNELAELNSDMAKGSGHLNDLRSGRYDYYNESAIATLQTKVYQISADLTDLELERYLTGLQALGNSAERANEKKLHYNELKNQLDVELIGYRNSRAKYIQTNFGTNAIQLNCTN